MTGTTIAAISTPFGKGGVALIRVSGADAFDICARVFFPRNGMALCEQPHARLTRGDIRVDGQTVDDGMAAVFFAPRSYTGEHVVEITCHGGILLTQTVLRGLFAAGARPAEAGEFTRRAFTAGKLSLSQAEAVMDLIDAETTEKLHLANAQSHGVLAQKTEELRQALLRAVSSIYAYIDFPDEDMTDYTSEQLHTDLCGILEELHRLTATYDTGRAISLGISTVICGKPNTGKSSLLNRLLGEERAIVTDIAGTTRDTIEETATVGRVMLRLCDTAGIHEAQDEVEALGIARSHKKLREAELVLCVFDPSRPYDERDRTVTEAVASSDAGCRIALLNKSDLPRVWTPEQVGLDTVFGTVLPISCASGEGIDTLRDTVEKRYVDGSLRYDTDAVLTNARQYAAAQLAEESVRRAVVALENGMTQDIAGMDLEEALAQLGALDGRQVTEEIVDTIFHRFCVGK